jgi:mRNA interferase YafQ
MSYVLFFSGHFKKDAKTCKKRNFDISLLEKILFDLRETGVLSQEFKPHKLSGNYIGRWECHIRPDWLLIWKQDDIEKIIYLERTGTHSDLF